MDNFSYQQLQRIKQLAVLFHKYKNEKLYKYKLSGPEKFFLIENVWEFEPETGRLSFIYSVH